MTKDEIEKMSGVKAIQTYFADSRPVTMAEFREMQKEERDELGALAKAALIAQL